MDKIITLDDLVVRDAQKNVEAWILWMCERAKSSKKIARGWDGKSVEGEAVMAYVNNGRWLGRCKICGNPIYVSYKTPILYCMECGNGGSRNAWPVEFPDERKQIEAALVKRPVELANPNRLIRNEVEFAFLAQPSIPGLRRDWRPGVSVEMLEAENAAGSGPHSGMIRPTPNKNRMRRAK